MFNKFLNTRSSEIKENDDIVKNIFYPRNLMFLDKKNIKFKHGYYVEF